ncbi:hypothetical protein BpHYR1_038619 [Brachionus plicatilis]|uniref:Uncharacterized protein n=1 Tax=Brachionus plicatilis TaxID=10195 RepID=A0A3M7PZW2_BRAPC|nr:hypothetical protein BpHYR1_038619 [Brachionus plicatilis]
MVSMVLVPYGINPNFDIVPRKLISLGQHLQSLENEEWSTFNSIGMDLPFHNNRKRDAPSKNVKSLEVQLSDFRKYQEENSIDDDKTTQEPNSKRKRLNANERKFCDTCGKPLQKKLNIYCPINKCKQKKIN